MFTRKNRKKVQESEPEDPNESNGQPAVWNVGVEVQTDHGNSNNESYIDEIEEEAKDDFMESDQLEGNVSQKTFDGAPSDTKWYGNKWFKSSSERMSKHYLDWLFRRQIGRAGVIGDETYSVSNSKKKMKKLSEPCKIYASNFSEPHSRKIMTEYFEQYGKVKAVKFRRYFGFFTFEHPSSMDKFMQDAPHEVNSYQISVIRADDRNYNRNLKRLEEILNYYGKKLITKKKSDVDGVAKPEVEINRVALTDVTEAHDIKSLEDYFWKFGTLTRLVVSKGRGVITYADPDAAKEVANQSSPHIINSDPITVALIVPRDGHPRSEDENPRKVFVGSLGIDVTQTDLEQYFHSFGDIEEIDLKKNKRDLCRGYGFITFCDFAVAKAVVAIADHKIKGRPVRVNRAVYHVRKRSKRYSQIIEKEPESEDEENDKDDVKAESTVEPTTTEETAVDLDHTKSDEEFSDLETHDFDLMEDDASTDDELSEEESLF